MLYVHAVRFLFLFFKQKTAYEMRISDWSSDVCSSDLIHALTRDQVQCTFNASVDLSRRLYKLKWTPSSATRICPARQGRALWSELLDRAALAASAQLLGLAQRMLDLGVDHAAQRKQFGKPVGSFQAVKHHFADVAVKVEFAEPEIGRDRKSTRLNSSH